MIKWDTRDTSGGSGGVPAAEYVRMSTEHQKYSTDNQSAAIRRYAEARGFGIVKTYADEGKSGLKIEGRDALKRLLEDVEKRQTNFSAILVYDVSRWGRFQDPDEAAAIELLCKKAGIAVHYCAEQFENDGSIGSSIIKTVKRAMAGEYSRELSVKVFAGQANLIRLGFRQGGPAGFGLRRVLVDQNGTQKGELAAGEHKSISTDRVILVPGPAEEVRVVREVYRLFLTERRSEREIASILNLRGVPTDLGRPWTRGTIHQLLINEKYIGNNVWGRTSFKLKQSRCDNPRKDWVRHDGAFSAIVEASEFEEAQSLIAARSERLSDEEMLRRLKEVLRAQGSLSGLIIDETEFCPSSSAFRFRFGSLLRAYTLVGYNPAHDYQYLEINRALRRMHPDVVRQVIDGIASAGGGAISDLKTDVLHVNGEFTASLVIARCRKTVAGSLRWKIILDQALQPDLTIAVRMNQANEAPKDYFLLPRLDMERAVLMLWEHNGLSLDAYRFESLSMVYEMAKRFMLRRAA
ncbi:recombinase family protein [Sphingosinicella sp. YJ22]|uniref:recombinase family protein n=1 Tax=Sphingosinicella sp. YJ22 TaxID=1104780 RepID=UPI001FAFA789|nr:recombinase family protein [Sphingosinicella sp. YJ22]